MVYMEQLIFRDRLNMGSPLRGCVNNLRRIDSPVKKKFVAQWSVKKIMLTVFREKKVSVTIDLL